MGKLTYDKRRTAHLVIDPYNDFISEGGKVWDRLKAVAEANRCVPHMLQVLNAARKAGIRVFYSLHRRYRPGDYKTWKTLAPTQKLAVSSKAFEYGTWGGETHEVGQKRPNAWGLYDMLGNVWEWCHDGHRTYTRASVIDPIGLTEAGVDRGVRGGGWDDEVPDVRAADRFWVDPGLCLDILSFRCVRSGPSR